MTDAGTIARALREAGRDGRFQVLGPAPAPFVKLRGEHRAQFFLKGRNRAAMRDAIRRALDALPDLRRRVAIDVDPISVLDGSFRVKKPNSESRKTTEGSEQAVLCLFWMDQAARSAPA
jgi:hypothetical protein